MISQILTAILLAASAALAAPTARSNTAICTPTTYIISSYSINPSPPSQSVHFVFRSTFPDNSTISDAAISGSVCDASADSSNSFPNEILCSTGRQNVEVDLRGPEESGKYQVIHFWGCDGKKWMSSTPVDIDVTSSGKEFQPQNVHEVPCGAPTCP